MFNFFKTRCHFLMRVSILVAVSISAPTPGWSFWADKFGLPISRHREITKEALEAWDTPLSFGKRVSFNKLHLEFIMLENDLTDDLQHPRLHCDNEEIFSCTRRLVLTKNTIINFLLNGQVGFALSSLGSALHTVQDFYSHTTQVERGGGVEKRLGDEPFGLSTSAIGDVCIGSDEILNSTLTSGYWWSPWDDEKNKQAEYEKDGYSKCIHGLFLPDQLGINKDGPSRRRDQFEAAKNLAIVSTMGYVNRIIDAIKTLSGTDEERDLRICYFLGVPDFENECVAKLVANAGPDQTVNVGATVQLDGSQSQSPSGSTFNWEILSKPTGSAATLSEATTIKPTFVADKEGPFSISLTVSSGSRSSFDIVLITAKALNGKINIIINSAAVAATPECSNINKFSESTAESGSLSVSGASFDGHVTTANLNWENIAIETGVSGSAQASSSNSISDLENRCSHSFNGWASYSFGVDFTPTTSVCISLEGQVDLTVLDRATAAVDLTFEAVSGGGTTSFQLGKARVQISNINPMISGSLTDTAPLHVQVRSPAVGVFYRLYGSISTLVSGPDIGNSTIAAGALNYDFKILPVDSCPP